MRLLGSQMTLHKLEIFCLVAQLDSVSRAADRIGVAQPVVTAHIRSLEDKLGIRLVTRQGRRIVLTEGGERVYRWASEIVTRTRELERELNEASGQAVGSVMVAASMTVGSYVLPRILADFRRDHPDGEIAVQISNPQAATDAVRDGACDFAVCILDPRHDVDGLTVERLWEEELALVAAPASALVGPSADAAAIAALPFVTSPRHQVRRELEDDALRAYGIVRERIVLELGHPEAMKQAVRHGAGVAFLFETCIADELSLGLLRKVETPGLRMAMPMFLVHRRGKSFSPLQNALIAFTRRNSPVAG